MFASREDAGRQLGRHLKQAGIQGDLVLGLPRGGVIVAAEVAHILELPLEVMIVRKIGHPWHREFAVGAMAENDVVVFDHKVLARNPLLQLELDAIISEEKERLSSYQQKFHRETLPDLSGKSVFLVDDGLATGATTEAAVLSARKQGARTIIVAAPVGSSTAVERLEKVADIVQVLWVDPDFDAVGRYYDVFSQTTDEEVVELLKQHSAPITGH
jgi:putative phosphoribosyl transferase